MNKVGTTTIETERLVLRRYTIKDAEDMYNNWTSDPEVAKFMPWPAHSDVNVTRELLTEWVSYYEDGGTYNWGITLKGDDHVIGNIAVVNKDEQMKTMEIGYCLSRAHWGKGIMPEALKAVIRYLFEGEKDLNRIFTTHDARNEKSGRVMQKAGMHYDGTLRDAKINKFGFYDAAYYSVLRSDLITEEQYVKLFDELRPNFFAREDVQERPEWAISWEELLRLKGFDPYKYIDKLPENITFEMYHGDLKPIHEAVCEVSPDWVQYFNEDSHIFCAKDNGKIISFALLENAGEHEVDGMKWKVGCPGCLGTIPEYRGRGIGGAMHLLLMKSFRDEFYDVCYLHNNARAKWYESFGCKKILQWNKNGIIKTRHFETKPVIRPMNAEDDRNAISHVYEESYKIAYKDVLPQEYLDSIPEGIWAEKPDQPDQETLVCTLEDKIIGFSLVSFIPSMEDPDYALILSISVLPEYMHMDLGTELLRETMTALKKKGFKGAYFWVPVENQIGLTFFIDLGAEILRAREISIDGKTLTDLYGYIKIPKNL